MKKILMIILAMMISLTSLPLYVFANDVSETAESQIAEQNEAIITDSADEPVAYAAASSSGGQWVQESNGRWWYKHADGSYTKYDWEYINGSWYFFDKNGWMWTEWLQWEGNWYYLNPSGVMHTGWLKDDGKWYYFNSQGIMVYRWNKINGYWYYFDGADGSMNKESFTYDKRTYTFYPYGDHEGALMTTKINIDRQQQEKSNWCWAASSVMVGTYYTDSQRGQYGTVFHVKKCWDNVGGNENEEIEAIDYASKGTKKCYSISRYNIVFNNLRDKIDENHPFLIRLKWNKDKDGKDKGGHAVVGAGYDQHLGKIWVIDPWEDVESQFYDFKGMIAGDYWFATGTGHCKAVLVY